MIEKSNSDIVQEKIEDAKGTIRNPKSKKDKQGRQFKGQLKKKTMFYKALHRKLKIEQCEPH